MTKSRLATMYAVWIQGIIACGSSTSDPIGGGQDDRDGGAGGMEASSGGGGGRSGSGGGVSGTGGRAATGGIANAGTGGGGAGGVVGDGGASASGGVAGSGGATAAGGTSGDAGTAACTPVHPNVNGSSRTCNTGFCYCSGNDGCFPTATASPCCVETVVCGPGAVDPVASIFHPGNGEVRAPNADIPFSGVASDPQDGDLTGGALVWTSSELVAPIGTGLSFQAALPAGTHVITLTATDADSNVGTDTITLTIQ